MNFVLPMLMLDNWHIVDHWMGTARPAMGPSPVWCLSCWWFLPIRSPCSSRSWGISKRPKRPLFEIVFEIRGQAATKRPPSAHQAAKRLVLSMPNAWILPTGLDSWTNTQILCHLVRADRDHPPQACGQTVGTLWLPHQPHLQMEKVQ